MEICILDYGAGNLKSMEKALAKAGGKPRVVEAGESFETLDALIIPGVGSFSCAKSINKEKRRILEFALKKPVLGVCLGMQILFEGSEESECRGLGLLKGKVRRFGGKAKIPQIGWNGIRKTKESRLLEGIADEERFYFVNSYAVFSCFCATSKCEYGEEEFVSSIESRNLFGVQFHPEKSGSAGLRLLGNFLRIAEGK